MQRASMFWPCFLKISRLCALNGSCAKTVTFGTVNCVVIY